MQRVFERFKELFEIRYNKISVLDLGEDSVRYDFFIALMDKFDLKSHQIQLESPFSSDMYTPRANVNSRRKEKPQMDLNINEPNLKLSAEFAMFKTSSNSLTPIDDTGNIFKMLNDFIRLAIWSKYNRTSAYFICFADSKMLNCQLRSKIIPAFPAGVYEFDSKKMLEIIGNYKSASKVDARFLNKLNELKLTIKSELVYEVSINSKINILESKLLVWEVKSN
jgi:hypothetical protein